MSRSSGRLHSLDVFRGATIASMILVNNPGSWSDVYAPLLHAEWHGWTFTDTVFPFFLWIVGVAMTLSFAKRVERGDDKARLLLHAMRRALLIFLLGFGLNLMGSMSFANVRIPGVLQRIGICYGIAAAIFLYTSIRGQIAAILLLFGVYTALMLQGATLWEKGSNFGAYVDNLVLEGHMWSQSKTWDPEGIVSTLPAIATVLLGALAGHLLRTNRPGNEKAGWLMSAGALVMALGHFLSFWMPINKSLWTPTYSLLMAGLAALTFGVWYWFVDLQGWTRWTRPFAIYGMNAILVFVLSGMLARFAAKTGLKTELMNALNSMFAPINASLAYAILNVFALYLVAWIFYRRGWFLRL